LDAGSWWALVNEVSFYMQRGKLAEARLSLRQLAATEGAPWAHWLELCMDSPQSPDVAAGSRKFSAEYLADPDPEVRYNVADSFLFCRQRDDAFALLKSSIIRDHFCAADGLQNNPAWASIRTTPEYAELLSAAKQCKANFLSQRSRTD
jgi:hypothetical protein